VANDERLYGSPLGSMSPKLNDWLARKS
jgi:hypothetical protein